ncbi:MAG: ribonuclease Y, partial [Lachnospiraceae bacterium]|nr:ribonuclease Y [Lachnospiraceae bacterium]
MTAVLCALVGFLMYKLGVAHQKKVFSEKIGTAEQKSREIIDDALKTAEAKKREALLEVKEESLRSKNELEKEIHDRRSEVSRSEKRVLNKEESLNRKIEAYEKRENALGQKEESLKKRAAEVEARHEEITRELERVSQMTSEQAKEQLLNTLEESVRNDKARIIRQIEQETREEANAKAKEIIVTAIQRCSAESVAENTITVVQIPSDEMKGRIIGREGRNIRALETATGVELIIDDTPDAVVLSAFDPVRREIARVALEKLIADGRIHPARIEEMVENAKREVEQKMREEGEKAIQEVGVHGIHPELVKLLGRMCYRTSYGQNALRHSIEVAHLSGLMAAELGLDIRMAKRAGLLHDIG